MINFPYLSPNGPVKYWIQTYECEDRKVYFLHLSVNRIINPIHHKIHFDELLPGQLNDLAPLKEQKKCILTIDNSQGIIIPIAIKIDEIRDKILINKVKLDQAISSSENYFQDVGKMIVSGIKDLTTTSDLYFTVELLMMANQSDELLRYYEERYERLLDADCEFVILDAILQVYKQWLTPDDSTFRALGVRNNTPAYNVDVFFEKFLNYLLEKNEDQLVPKDYSQQLGLCMYNLLSHMLKVDCDRYKDNDKQIGCNLITLLIKAGADVNATPVGNAKMALCMALRFGAPTELIRLMLDKGAPVNGDPSTDRIPLHYASMGKSVENLKLILERGGNIYLKDNLKTSFLMSLARLNVEEFRSLFPLLDSLELDVSEPELIDNAVTKYNPYLAEWLCTRGAQIFYNEDGKVSILAQKRIDNLKHSGLNPRHPERVKEMEHLNMLIEILDKEEKKRNNIKDAVIRGDVEEVFNLLPPGSNLDVPLNSEGVTPLSLAIDHHHDELALKLVKQGATFNNVDLQSKVDPNLLKQFEEAVNTNISAMSAAKKAGILNRACPRFFSDKKLTYRELIPEIATEIRQRSYSTSYLKKIPMYILAIALATEDLHDDALLIVSEIDEERYLRLIPHLSLNVVNLYLKKFKKDCYPTQNAKEGYITVPFDLPDLAKLENDILNVKIESGREGQESLGTLEMIYMESKLPLKRHHERLIRFKEQLQEMKADKELLTRVDNEIESVKACLDKLVTIKKLIDEKKLALEGSEEMPDVTVA